MAGQRLSQVERLNWRKALLGARDTFCAPDCHGKCKIPDIWLLSDAVTMVL